MVLFGYQATRTDWSQQMTGQETTRRAFGAWLKETRRQRGLTQQQAAEASEIARQQWIRLENGESGTRADTLKKIASALEVDVNEVYARAYGGGVRVDNAEVSPLTASQLLSTELPTQQSRVYDTLRRRERVVQRVEDRGRMVFLTLLDPASGTVERQPFSREALNARFQPVGGGAGFLRRDASLTRLIAEAVRLRHAYLFNPVSATETSLIDPLPHQLIAIYGVPGRPGLLSYPRLRFLLADDAGAGKTIMAGLYMREMLLRRLIRRILIVTPAGLVGNWEKELRSLFRLRFRILESGELRNADPEQLSEDRYSQCIISLDTLRQDRIQALMDDALPYDLVIFDEAHKLSARRNPDMTDDTSRRYRAAQVLADRAHHLLLLTATPHMGRADAYWYLWRLMDPKEFSTPLSLERAAPEIRRDHLLRRLKEEMVDFSGNRLFPRRTSRTVKYELNPAEKDLYDHVTEYVEDNYSKTTSGNRNTVGLALTVIQRRLASSAYALWTSLGRRREKLKLAMEEIEKKDEQAFREEQDSLRVVDTRALKTGDEEETIDGQEEAERTEEQALAATSARTKADLQTEILLLNRLVEEAGAVYRAESEIKFEKLWEVMSEHPRTKILIFTEHRDTLTFLVKRLGQRGVDPIATIHGGMDYREREQQAELFRSPECRCLIATDAAGEGINLQFCWLLINYDIPWNPARLEQRMGRVHRYKQTHDVELFSLVADNTREGRVLAVLLDKLERIRESLNSDKVFDVIGEQLSGVSLADLLRRVALENRGDEALTIIDEQFDPERFAQRLALSERRVEVEHVRNQLAAIQKERDSSEDRRMMPAYVRACIEETLPHLGMTIGQDGSVDGIFRLIQADELVERALNSYPEELRSRLTFQRELALPREARSPQAIYLHPGEIVFDTIMNLFLARFGDRGERGGVFYDPLSEDPYFFALARVAVVRPILNDENEPQEAQETIREELTGIRILPGGSPELVPPHRLLDLTPAPPDAMPEAAANLAAQLAVAFDKEETDTAVETYLLETRGLAMEEQLRQELAERRTERQAQIQMAFNSREAEGLGQLFRLQDDAARGVPAAESKRRTLERELNRLETDRTLALGRLDAEIDYLSLTPVTIYVRALVLPLPPGIAEGTGMTLTWAAEVAESDSPRDPRFAEDVAMREAEAFEVAAGAKVRNISKEGQGLGYDLLSTRPDGSIRYIEVKGRTGINTVSLTPNEWRQAANHPDRYWLYVVYHCETPAPSLHTVPNPFAVLTDRGNGVAFLHNDIITVEAEG